MQTFLNKLCKALRKRFHGAKYFVSNVNFAANRREQAPLWLNFQIGDNVMGIDFCNRPQKEDSVLEVSVFKRSLPQLNVASPVEPMSQDDWNRMLRYKTSFALMNYQWREDVPQGGGLRAGTCYDIHLVGTRVIVCDIVEVINQIQRSLCGTAIDRMLAVIGCCRLRWLV